MRTKTIPATAQFDRSTAQKPGHNRTRLLATTALVAGISLAGMAGAQTTWSGAAGIEWSDPLNWSDDVPGVNDPNATIGATNTNQPTLSGSSGMLVSTSIAAGILTISSTGTLTSGISTTNGVLISGTGAVVNEGVITGNVEVTGGTLTNNGTLTGNLRANGPATTYSGSGTLNGSMTVFSGTLTLGSSVTTTSFVDVQGSNSARLDLGGNTLSVVDATVSANNTSTVTNGTLQVTTMTTIGAGQVDAVLAGSGGLTKVAAGFTGTLGRVNTYTGSTTVQDGTLSITTGSILTTSDISIQTNGILRVDGEGGNAIADNLGLQNIGRFEVSGTDETIGSIFGTGTIGVASGTKLVLTDGSSQTVSGVISGDGGLEINKSGGLVELSGTNAYTGTTTVTSGKLLLSNGQAIADAGAVTVNGGVLELNGNETIGALNGGAGGAIQTGGNVLTVNTAAGTNSAFAGTINGTGQALVKRGLGELTLTGAVTVDRLEVGGGTLTLGNAGNDWDYAYLEQNARINLTVDGADGGTGGQNIISVRDVGTVGLGAGVDNRKDIVSHLPNNVALNTTTIDVTTGTADQTGRVNLTAGGAGTGADVAASGALVKTGAGTLNLGNTGNVFRRITTQGGETNLSNGTVTTAVVNGGDLTISGGTGLTTASVNNGTLTLNAGVGALTAVALGTGPATMGEEDRLVIGTALGAGTTITTQGSVIEYLADSAAAIVLNSNTTQLEVNGAGSFTQSGDITETNGPRPLEKIGTGTLTLSGANTYAGATSVAEGNLTITSSIASEVVTVGTASTTAGLTLNNVAGAVSDTAAITLNGASSLTLGAAETVGSLATTSTGATVVLGSNTLTLGDGSGSLAGVISGTGGSLIKAGTGTQTLAGTNTYTGTTTVTAGVLNITGSVASGVINIDGGSLRVGGESVANSAAVTLTGTGNLDLTNNETIGTLNSASDDATVTLGASGLTLVGSGPQTFDGVISSDVGAPTSIDLTHSGTGNLTLRGQNTFTGQLVINGGGTVTLNNSGGNALADGVFVNGAGVGSTLDLQTSETFGGLNGDIAVNLNGNTATLTNGDVTVIQNGEISGTGNVVINEAIQTFGGANTYNGTTTVTSGTLTLAGGAAIVDAGAVIVNGGTLALSASETIGSLAGTGGGVDLTGRTLTTGGNNGATGYAGIISGGGALIKEGTGNFTLSGANTYTGNTSINAGTLTLAAAGSIDSALVTVGAAGTLVAQGNSFAAATGVTNNNIFNVTGNEALGALINTSTVNIADNTELAATTITNTTGTISVGDGATLKGTANTLDNSATINVGTGGTVTDAGDIKNLATGIINFNGPGGTGTLETTGATTTITNDNQINLVSGDLNIIGPLENNASGDITISTGAGDINHTGTLTNLGDIALADSTLTTTGLNLNGGTITGDTGNVVVNGTFNQSAGTIGVDFVANTYEFSNTGALTVAPVLGNNGATASTLLQSGGGTTTLSNTNTYTGATTVDAGVLDVTGSIRSSSVVVNDAGGLIVHGASLDDTAAVTLNTGGDLIVNTTTETIGSLTATSIASTVVLNAGLIVGDNTNTTVASAISGSGGLTKQGSGTLTLSGTSTNTGPLVVNNGTIALTGSFEAGSVTLNGNGTENGTLTVTDSGLAAGAAVTVAGGTLNINSDPETVASVVLNGGEVSGDAVLNTGTFSQNTGTLSGLVTLDAASSTATLQGGTISGTLDATILGAVTTASAGTTGVTGAILTDDMIIASGATVNVTGAGVLDSSRPIKVNGGTLGTDGATGGGGIADGNNLRLTAGTLNVTGDDTIASIEGTGTVNLTGATLTTSGSFVTEFSGVMQGTGGLTTEGGNQLTLSGTNLYTGDTTINGTAQVGVTGSIASAQVTVNNSGLLDLIDGNSMADTAAVTLNDTGRMQLTNGNETIASLDGTVGSTLTLNIGSLTLGSGTMAGQITGNAGITKTGAGTLTLTGTTSDYIGATTITAGTLAVDNANALGAASRPVNLIGGTLLGLADTVLAKSEFNLVANSTIAAANGTSLTIAGVANILNNNLTLSIGDATNAGTVIAAPTGPGVSDATLSVDIVNGTLRMGSAAAGAGLLAGIAGTDIASAGLLDLGGFDTAVGNLTGTGGVINSGADAALQTSGTSTFGGDISDGPSGGTTALDVAGGELTLTTAQTFTGSTTLSGGNLVLSGDGALVSTAVDLRDNTLETDGGGLAPASTVTSAGGTLILTGDEVFASFNDTTAGTINLNGGDLTLNSGVSDIGSLITGNGGLTITGTAPTAAVATLTGANDFTGGLAVTGAASANLNGAATYTGDTVIDTTGLVTVNGTLGATSGNTILQNGELRMVGDATQAVVDQSGGSITGPGLLTAATSFIQTGGSVAGLVETPVFIMTDGTITGTVTASDTATLSGNNALNGTLAGAGTGAMTVTADTTTLNASGAITGMASIDVDAGATLITGAAQQIDDGSVVTVDGTLTLGGAETLGGLNGAASGVVNNASGLTLGTAGSTLASSFAGGIDGAGGLVVAGGSQTLSGTNGYTGATDVTGGTLTVTGTLASTDLETESGGTLVAGTNALAATAVLDNEGTLQVTGDNGIASVSGAGGITLTGTGTELTLNDGASSITGVISGNGALVVTGTSGTILSGDNTYTGGTSITGGQLTVVAGGTLGALTGSTAISNGILTINTDVTQANVTQSGGEINGSGILTTTDSFIHTGVTISSEVITPVFAMTDGTITSPDGQVTATTSAMLNGTNQIDGTLTGDRDASITGTAGGATTIATGTTTIGATGAITNMVSIDVDTGATLITSAAQQIDDGSVVTVDGTLTLGGAETLGGLNGAASGVVNNASGLTLGTTGGSFAGGISGAGGLVVTGGTQVLTGSNSFTGPVNVTGGILSVTAGGTLDALDLETTGGTLATEGDALAAAAVITNAGTLALTGDEVVAAVSGAGAITLTDADLTLTTGTSSIGGTISGDGGLNVNSGSTTTLSGANTYGGSTDVQGSLTVAATGAIAGATTVTGSLINNGSVQGVTNNNGFTNNGSAGAVTNSATFTNSASGVAGDVGNTGTFANNGGQTGALTNTGTATNSGTVRAVAQNDGSFDNSGTVAGNVTVAAGSFTHSGAVAGDVTVAAGSTANINGGSVTGTTTNTGGAVNIDGGGFTGQVTNTSGTLTAAGTVSGTIENAAVMNVTGALMLDGSIINTGTGLFTTTGSTTTSGSVTNQGTMNAEGALNSAVNNANAFTVTGALTATGEAFTNTASLNIAASSYTGLGAVTNNGAGVIDLGGGTLGAFSLTNNNIVNANGANLSGAITNNLTFNAQGATLAGSVANSAAGVFDLTGGTLAGSASNAGQFILTNGSVSGGFTNNGTLVALGNTSVGALSGAGTVSLLSPRDATGTPDFATNTADRLTVNGDLNGGNFILDLNMGSRTPGGSLSNVPGGSSDQIIVAGAVTGSLNFDFQNLVPEGVGPFFGEGILVLDGSVASNYDFTYSGLGAGGAVIYSLAKVDNDLQVISETSAGIGGVAANASLVQSLIGTVVNRPTSPFVSGLATEEGCSRGGYFRGTYGVSTVSGDSNNGVSTSNAEVRARYAGAQGGFDIGCNDGRFFDGWDGSFGAMVGYNTGKSDQDVMIGTSGGGTTVASITQSDFDQKYVGAYAAFGKDRITADVQVRFEKTDFTLNEIVAPGFFGLGLKDTEFDTNSVNVTGRVSYRMDLNDEGLNFIPTGGLSYTRTSSANVNFTGGESLEIEGFNSIVGFVGGTLARTTLAPAGNAGTTYFGSANYYHDFAGDRNSIFTDRLGGTQSITTKTIGGFGELSMGVNYVRILESGLGGAKQLNANVRLDGRFGSNVKNAASITAQVRLSF